MNGLSIEERIRDLTRAEYDDISHPGLPEGQISPELAFFRLDELARFWEDPQTGGESLLDRQQRLITSLCGIHQPWAYVILGEGGSASILLGLPCRGSKPQSWEQRLSAQLPGSIWRMDQSAPQILAQLAALPMVAGMTGNPSLGDPDTQRQADANRNLPGLESLFETMAGVRWAYTVLARPLPAPEVAAELRRTEDEILEMNSSFLRGGSAEERNNPKVSRYVALLETARKKLVRGQSQGMWEVQSFLMTATAETCEWGSQALHGAFAGPGSEPQPIRVKIGNRLGVDGPAAPMTTRLNTSEVAVMASLPRRDVAGLQVRDYVQFSLTSGVKGIGDFVFGTIMAGGAVTQRWFEIFKDSLSMHLFVAGVPGSGKTRTCLYLLYQLWHEHRIPWLCLEPSMKSEYRALLRSSIGPDMRVFTAGNETVAPLRLNPLEVLDGVSVQTHIGELATLFRAAFAMEAPIPYVLDEAIHRVYEEKGWDLIGGSHPSRDAACQPTLAELLETCGRVVDELGHEERVKANIRGAIKTRLSSLMRGAKGAMLNVRQSIPIEDLLSVPTVIEFAAIGDDDEKAFLLGCILLKMAQYRQVQGLSKEGLRHATLVEEAHRLLRNAADVAGTGVANPRGQAVEKFSHMLAELRAFGEGLIVVDQMPSKLVPDVIRNSGLKIVHRLTAKEEREIVGGAMALNETQTRSLASLPSGQAIVYADGSINACRIRIPDHAGSEGYLRDNTTHGDIREHMQPYYRSLAESQKLLTDKAVQSPSDEVSSRCGNTCPSTRCELLVPIDAYLREHAAVLDRGFQNAIEGGFEDLWRFGASIAQAVWPDGCRKQDGPLCAVMVAAVRAGMPERDVLVLRRNMIRLRDGRQQGGGCQ